MKIGKVKKLVPEVPPRGRPRRNVKREAAIERANALEPGQEFSITGDLDELNTLYSGISNRTQRPWVCSIFRSEKRIKFYRPED